MSILTGQLPGRLSLDAASASSSSSNVSRGSIAVGQKGFLQTKQPAAASLPGRSPQAARLAIQTGTGPDVDTRNLQAAGRRHQLAPELQVVQPFPEGSGTLPAVLYRLLDPAANVELPPPGAVRLSAADNRELDKLVAALGRSKSTWRRALALHEWLLSAGHRPDDRLCTTLIRVCAQHGQAAAALGIYDWMRAAPERGGGGLACTVYTYTAAMRAALAGNMVERALQVWDDAVAGQCEVDSRLCTTLIEVCARKGDTDRALQAYGSMRDAPRDSRMAPSVHAYTAAMRAATEGGCWEAALRVWEDMGSAGCKPTGHAYAAVISACAAGGQWQRAVALFDEMLGLGVKPDVVSCTALITALGTDGQWERAEKVVEWMHRSDIRPNVRTYTALITALGNARQWGRALEVVGRMRSHAYGSGLEPNAYTYSALLKTMGEQARWQLAEGLFTELESEHLGLMAREAQLDAAQQLAAAAAATGLLPFGAAPGVSPLGPLSVGSPSATSPALSAASAEELLLSSGGGGLTPGLAAFPGMRKTVPLDLPSGTTSSGGSGVAAGRPAAIAAAAAAVAAMAASRRQAGSDPSAAAASAQGWLPQGAPLQQLLASAAAVAGGGDTPDEASASLLAASTAELVPGAATVGGGPLPEVAAPTAGSPEPGSVQDAHGTSASGITPFSYFSKAGNGGAQGGGGNGSEAAPADVEAHSPDSVAGAAAAWGAAVRSGSSSPRGAWTTDNAAVRGLQFSLGDFGTPAAAAAAAEAGAHAAGPLRLRPLPRGKGPVNEVVCGALMLAYERAGKWEECVAVLERARQLGLSPNTVMHNTAMSALGKAQQVEAAEALFEQLASPDDVSYETIIAAYGMSGQADKAEAAFARMKAAGFTLRDYAYCGLVAAHSFKGDWRSALSVKERMDAAGVAPTVHVYNALIAACDRGKQYERAVQVATDMGKQGIAHNAVTQQLLEGVRKEGVRAVESQQAAAAALSAAVAAAGTIMMRVGLF